MLDDWEYNDLYHEDKAAHEGCLILAGVALLCGVGFWGVVGWVAWKLLAG